MSMIKRKLFHTSSAIHYQFTQLFHYPVNRWRRKALEWQLQTGSLGRPSTRWAGDLVKVVANRRLRRPKTVCRGNLRGSPMSSSGRPMAKTNGRTNKYH
ncbi:hypothetical protein EVAR_34327_1 [Eumeta japonica]|uniref:Uncharacterized protein n=1 Tax=Eumeta variegata TaxID=151549 RepID=A0A4C1VF60_EUMVA|nr:hypothetical protein EVAR_34327_1 [Eumeta japonica]